MIITIQDVDKQLEESKHQRLHLSMIDRQIYYYDDNNSNNNLWYGTDYFLSYLESNYSIIDCMTYSCFNPDLLYNIRNVITGIVPTVPWKKAKVFLSPCNHSKVYFGFKKTKLKDTFIGSKNYTPYNGSHELMVKVEKKYGEFLYKQFKNLIKYKESLL